MRVTPKSALGHPGGSIAPHIVVGDGQSHDMVRSPASTEIYEFEYKLPSFQDKIGYYYLVDYSAQNNGQNETRQAFTPIQHATIVNRYVLSLEVNRGPVGARIGVLGRGFTPQDQIGFDGTPGAHGL